MTTTCPACSKIVDPLRSRFIGVTDGKVVAYCSAECAAKGSPASAASSIAPSIAPSISSPIASSGPATSVPGKPAAVPAKVPASAKTPSTGVPVGPVGPPRPDTPAPGVPISLESGPVIEIVREPASGVVTPVRAEHSEPRAKHPDEIPMAAFWSADKEKSGATRAAGSGPGPGSGSGSGPGPGVVRSAADDTPAPRVAERSHARALSEPGDVADELPRKSRAPLVVAVVLALGAGGFLVYQYLLKSNVSAATRASPPEAAPGTPSSPGAAHVRGPDTATVEVAGTTPVPPAAPAAPPAPIDREAAVAQARGVLTQALTTTSLRVQHLAAAALARTEDPVARDVLAAQLGLPVGHPAAGAGGTASGAVGGAAGGAVSRAASGPIEPSDIAKLDLAYALARSGDRRGSELLAGALRSVRGEVRDESARLLALLGDPRGVPHLLDLLAIPQRRLGAAESLAHLVEPHALKVLQQLCADPKTSADDRIRATIALGIAGQAGVGPALHGMLDNSHFNAFAAAALAEQHDAAARPVLEQQLVSTVLRVRAARALRRLDPGGDPTPVLPGLLAVLRTGRDTDQLQAAEAILLLAGPPSWSAYE